MPRKAKKSPTFYIPTTDSIEPGTLRIDSRDVIARIEDLQLADSNNPLSDDDAEELKQLLELQEEASSSPDWEHGEALILDSDFTEYTEELIRDCYEMPKDLESGAWPWRHMTLDYEAAAQELKQDYMEVTYAGHTYQIRA